MIDWLWLWIAGIMQRRQLKRVLALEAAADVAMAAADPPKVLEVDHRQLGGAFLGALAQQAPQQYLFSQLYGQQQMPPEQLAVMRKMQMLQKQKDQYGAIGSALGNLFGSLGGGRKH